MQRAWTHHEGEATNLDVNELNLRKFVHNGLDSGLKAERIGANGARHKPSASTQKGADERRWGLAKVAESILRRHLRFPTCTCTCTCTACAPTPSHCTHCIQKRPLLLLLGTVYKYRLQVQGGTRRGVRGVRRETIPHSPILRYLACAARRGPRAG